MPPKLASVSPTQHRPGDVIAERYELREKLGEGGMGFVWVARSLALDVDVALKLLRPEIAGPEAIERMAREARTAAQLGHPAMVRVLDFGNSARGEPFLAMELLQGEELQSLLLREQHLTAERAAALLLPVIDGLGTAHEKGIVHRDIKPANIFIASDGQGRIQPKVLDFGIAKLDHRHVSTQLTQVGAVLGSPQYLSPEQAEGLEDVDARSDIWAVGVVLYELVTGVPPFEAANYNALIRKIMRDTPKPTMELGAGDAQFWTIIERCLKKDPAQRWSSMWELGEALALWLFERGVRVDAASRSIKHDWLDSGVTGLQILVGSEAPETLAPPSKPSVEVISVPNLPSPTLLAAVPATPAPGRAAWPLALLLAALVGTGALGFTLLRPGSAARPVAATKAAAPAMASPPIAEERVLGAVSSLVSVPAVTAESPTKAPSVPLTAASSSAAAEAAKPAASSPVPSAARASSRAPRSSPSATRATSPRQATPRKGLNTEFGF